MKREYLDTIKVHKRPSDVGDYFPYQHIGRKRSKLLSPEGIDVLERTRRYKRATGVKFVDGDLNSMTAAPTASESKFTPEEIRMAAMIGLTPDEVRHELLAAKGLKQ